MKNCPWERPPICSSIFFVVVVVVILVVVVVVVVDVDVRERVPRFPSFPSSKQARGGAPIGARGSRIGGGLGIEDVR